MSIPVTCQPVVWELPQEPRQQPQSTDPGDFQGQMPQRTTSVLKVMLPGKGRAELTPPSSVPSWGQVLLHPTNFLASYLPQLPKGSP